MFVKFDNRVSASKGPGPSRGSCDGDRLAKHRSPRYTDRLEESPGDGTRARAAAVEEKRSNFWG